MEISEQEILDLRLAALRERFLDGELSDEDLQREIKAIGEEQAAQPALLDDAMPPGGPPESRFDRFVVAFRDAVNTFADAYLGRSQ